MSMDRCSKCSRLVDTDYDCDFYPEEGEGLCEPCREDEALKADPDFTTWLDSLEGTHGHSHGH